MALACIAAALCAFISAVGGAGFAVSALMALLIVGSALVALVVDYRRKRSFYADLVACIDDVEHPLWITEMMDRPEFWKGAWRTRHFAAFPKRPMMTWRSIVVRLRIIASTSKRGYMSQVALGRLPLDVGKPYGGGARRRDGREASC